MCNPLICLHDHPMVQADLQVLEIPIVSEKNNVSICDLSLYAAVFCVVDEILYVP